MKKIYLSIISIMIFALAIIVVGCGGSSSKDTLVGTWQHQVQAPVSAKRIDEIVITKEDGKYLMQYFVWKYQDDILLDKNGRVARTPDNKTLVSLELNRKIHFHHKYLMEKQGESYVVNVPLNRVTITPNNGKLDIIGIDVSGKVSFEKKDDNKFKAMIDEHKNSLITIRKYIPERYSVQIDNSILEKK